MNAAVRLEQRALEMQGAGSKKMRSPSASRSIPAMCVGNIGDAGDSPPDKALTSPQLLNKAGEAGDDPEPVARFELAVKDDNSRVPGVYWVGVTRDKDGTVTGQAAPVWICSPLRVAAMTRDIHGGEWGRLLVFNDRDGREHRWTMPMRMLAGNADGLRGELLAEGLTIATDPRARALLPDYLQRERPEVTARCVTRTGWHGDVFVLPRETIGDTDSEPVLYQAASLGGVPLGQAGTLEGWRENVAACCTGNSRLVLAICAGFAGPCLGLLGMDGGGFHLRGKSSCGKSSALEVAASMFGPKGFKREWRTTGNGLEGLATLHSDLLLILDEIKQIDPKDAGQAAYLLANGQGKVRAARDGTPRAATEWRVLLLSAGELGLADIATQHGGKMHAGQEVRLIDIPADAGAGLGLFESMPEGISPGSFSDALKVATGKHHGHAALVFLRGLVADPAKARGVLAAMREKVARTLTGVEAAGQVRRVAHRFALLAAAGELATAWGLTGWPTGEAERAARTCFLAWIGARGTAGDAEPAAMRNQVRAFLSAHGESRFTDWEAGEQALRTINRAGYRRASANGPTFYIETEVFKRELCAGFDAGTVARALGDTGALEVAGDGRLTHKKRLPDGRNARVYVVTPALWGDP